MSQTVFGPKSEVRSLKEFVKDDDKLHPRQKKKVKWLKEEPQIVVGKDNKLEVVSEAQLLDEFLKNLSDEPIDITIEQTITQPKADISPTAFLGDVSALDSFLESIQKEEEVIPQPEEKPLIKEVIETIKPPSLTKPKTNKPQLDPNIKAVTDRLNAFERRLSDMALRPMGQDPGGGETRLRFLDDVDRSTIGDGKYLNYNETTQKFQFTTLSGGGAPQVQSDWTQSDNTEPSFIKNKPSLFSGDYNDLDNLPTLFSGSYNDLTDKPTIPAAQIQSDWNQATNTALDYIKNKPTIPDTLNSLTDVVITNPLNNQVLKYDAVDHVWVNGSDDTTSSGGNTGYYLSAYDTTDQVCSAINTATPVKFNNTTFGANGILIGATNSHIIIANGGVYNVQFSFQFHNQGGGGNGTTVQIWLAQNGTAIPDTNTRVDVITNSPYIVAAWNFVVPVDAGDYLELMWSTDNTNIVIDANSSVAPGPHIPSAIVTVTPVANIIAAENISGNAATADRLHNARTINGVSFNGTADITIPDIYAVNPTPSPGDAFSANVVASTSSGTNAVTINATTGLPGFGSTQSWYFTYDGYIKFPDNSLQSTAWTGTYSYTNLTDKPTLFSGSYNDLTNKPSLFSGSYADLTNKPTLFSGSYTDLTNKPTLFSGAGSDLTGTSLATGIVSSSLTSVGTLSSLSVTYTPATTTGSAITTTGKDTQGGTGYFDFFKATNTTSGVTNPNKTFRLTSTGTVEIINSAYSATLLSLSDAGYLSVSGDYRVNGKKAVNGPSFRAYVATGQQITSGSQQKVTFGTENFDTDGCFASSTFTPNVEGYYQFNATVRISGGASTGECMLVLYKNGSEYARGNNQSGTEQGASFYSMQVSDIAYANGTTDNFDIRIQQTSGGDKTTTAGSTISYFSGCMIRGA
jgi:hypothetical protein